MLPFLLFLALFVIIGINAKDSFDNKYLIVAGIVVTAFTLFMNRRVSLTEKVETFSKGAGHPNVLIMVLIFLLAGVLGEIAEQMGAVDSTVNMGLSVLPPNLLLVGLFFICCFISLAMGTSMGTIVAITPIAIGLADETSIPLLLALGTTIGGAMFGDNLSFISDTTIAATRTQGVAMKDKFIMNFIIVLPAAILTAIIVGVLSIGDTADLSGDHPFNVIKILPYIGIIVVALLGVDVVMVLIGGAAFASVIGLIDGSFGFLGLVEAAAEGIEGMEDLVVIALVLAGLAELIKLNGGVDYLLNTIKRKVNSKKGAEFGISSLVSIFDVGVSNNTVAIIMAGPLAKQIGDEYGVEPRRNASLLDIFSCTFQGLIPHGGQILAVAGLASVSPIAIIPYSFYPMLAGIFGILAIVFGFPRKKKTTTSTYKVKEG